MSAEQPLEYLKTLTILYVEDDNDTRKLFSEYLQRLFSRVILAENGIAGLEAFHKHRPHIIITDVQMPSMDGLTMAKQIRENNSSVPIIVLTAFQNIDYLMTAIEVSIDRFVEKPIRISKILQSLQHCANRVLIEKTLSDQQQEMTNRVISTHRLESIGRLTSAIAHDFNNKLNVISGFAELGVMFSRSHDKTFEYLVEITRAADSAKKLIEHLMMISRKQDTLISNVDVNVIISMSGKSLSLLHGKVDFNFKLEPNIHKIKLDPIQIDRVFMNLAKNALDAMPHGGTLTVETSNTTLGEDSLERAGDNYICLSVSDDGEGMDEHTKSHIFEYLFTTKAAGKGTGFGLSTVHEIVTQNKGFITVESQQGIGSKFSLYLPAIVPTSVVSEKSDAPADQVDTIQFVN